MSKYITVNDAVKMAKDMGIPISKPTVIKYIEEFKLGRQLGGKGSSFSIDKLKWKEFLDADNK